MKYLEIIFRISVLLIMIILGFTVVFPEWLDFKDILISEYKAQKAIEKRELLADKAAKKQKAREWVLATCAILTEMNRRDHRVLGGRNKAIKSDVANARKILDKWWGISTREALFDILNWIKTAGHRRDFNFLKEKLSILPPEEICRVKKHYSNNSNALNKIEIVLKYQKGLGAKSIIAWDYARYVSLCGWGYIVGFITEKEAWELLMPVGQLLQKTFNSWEDLGVNYIIGRQFWSKIQTDKQGKIVENIYKNLLTDPHSPWKRLNWDLDLTLGQ